MTDIETKKNKLIVKYIYNETIRVEEHLLTKVIINMVQFKNNCKESFEWKRSTEMEGSEFN
jgi:hypothetical protein